VSDVTRDISIVTRLAWIEGRNGYDRFYFVSDVTVIFPWLRG
jgi:hypothetical protein